MKFACIFIIATLAWSCSNIKKSDDSYLSKSDSLMVAIRVAKDSLNKYKLSNPHKYSSEMILLEKTFNCTKEIDRINRSIIKEAYISKENINSFKSAKDDLIKY